MSLVLLKEELHNRFNLISVWVYLEGNNAVSIKERLNVMHAKFHRCGTTPSLSAYELSPHPKTSI